MVRPFYCFVLLLNVLFACVGRTAIAQEAVSRGLIAPRLTGYAEVGIADKYLYHGFIVETRGPVVQPYLELYGQFYEGAGLLSSASAKLAIFNSFQLSHDGRMGISEPLRSWYEAEIKPGIELTLAKELTFTASYRRFESPNGAYGSSNGLEFALTFDDTRLLGAIALHPHALWIAPLDFGSNASEGHYFEAGVTPSVVLGGGPRYPLTASFPVTLGFGDQRLYSGRNFGFASAGLSLSVPLAFVPEGMGKWTFATSGTYYRLGTTAAEFTNNGSRDTGQVAGTLSVGF
ncbi:MAG: hypothetical protein ABR526_12675 [Chthoniobacterales bacterium]